VTDNLGTTSAPVTQSVTVSTAQPPIAADAFGRTVASGWGTADTGGPWTVTTGTGGSSTVNGSAGQLTTTKAGWTNTVTQNTVSARDLALQAKVATGLPNTGSTYLTFLVRRVSATTNYQSQVRITSAGVVTLVLQKVVNGTATTLRSVTVAGLTYTAGMPLQVLTDVSGSGTTTLQAKVWQDGTTVPATWTASATDTEAVLQAAGSIGLSQYIGSTVTPPVTLTVDDWWAGVSGATRP
jgi:hypothetical protein